MEKIKVLIADDHRVVREGLAAILKTKDDIHIVGEAQDGMEAVEKVKTLMPDVVLMDVSMPRMGGVEATRQIKREFPHIGIVALTMYDEQQYIFDLVRAGATGYLLKDSESSQIVAAIRAIYKGESLIHPSVASKILAEFSLMSQKKGKKPGWVEHDLTEREITVLRLVADGKTNKEIANNLDLSEKTVKNHVRNIFHKLQVYDRTQAAILAIRKGLIELDPGHSRDTNINTSLVRQATCGSSSSNLKKSTYTRSSCIAAELGLIILEKSQVSCFCNTASHASS